MRIAMFHSRLPEAGKKPGGVEVYVHRLAEALAARNHEVEILTHMTRPPGASYGTRQLWPHLAASRRFVRQYVSPWLLNREDVGDFDVFHFHGDDWFYWRRSVPVVRTFHGSALFEARTATSLRRQIDKRAIYRLEKLSARLATCSYGVGTDSERIYHADGILPPGVDIPRAQVDRSPIPVILFVGTWGGRKRGSLLQKVFTEEIQPAIPNAELWMVSDRYEEWEGVRWIRHPSDSELSDLYAQAWAFCMPSNYEGFGIPYIEAMAHGTPVVTTPNPGAEMVLEGGRYGLIADEADLGRRLIEVLETSGIRESMGREGRLRAQHYSWQQSADRHLSAYQSAIARHASRRGA